MPAVASTLDVPDIAGPSDVDANPVSGESESFFNAPNPNETPLVKSDEEQKQDKDNALLGAGALGAVGAGIAGIAMSDTHEEAEEPTAKKIDEQPTALSAIPASVLERLEQNATDKAGEGEVSTGSLIVATALLSCLTRCVTSWPVDLDQLCVRRACDDASVGDGSSYRGPFDARCR